MFVDDYVPMKRIGIEELEGACSILEQRMDGRMVEGSSETPEQFRDEGAWLTLHLLLTSRFRYPKDFVAVFDIKCAEVFD